MAQFSSRYNSISNNSLGDNKLFDSVAYCCRTQFKDPVTGKLTTDYSLPCHNINEKWLAGGIEFPENFDDALKQKLSDRNYLYNSIIENENRKPKARLVKRMRFNIPREFNKKQAIAFSKSVVKSFAKRGLIVDWNIH